MARYRRLPNGFGCIKHLSGNRRNPYAVYLPASEYDLDGNAKRKILCYVDSYLKGVEALTAWHKGIFNITDLQMSFLNSFTQTQGGLTFEQVYEQFIADKFSEKKDRKYSEATKNALQASYGHFSEIHSRPFAKIKYAELQDIIDDLEGSKAKRDAAINLLKQMWKFAIKYEICEKNVTEHLVCNKADDTVHGEAFTEDEIKILWEHQDDPIIEMILIMIYSGFRISAYPTLRIDLQENYFQGGVKTAAGKDRIVPIHSAILPLVQNQKEMLLGMPVKTFRERFKERLSQLGMEHHPHDTRHTFSALCERYGVNEADRKRMLGHSFGTDITNGIYGHRTVEELREQIEKIKVPCYPFVTTDIAG